MDYNQTWILKTASVLVCKFAPYGGGIIYDCTQSKAHLVYTWDIFVQYSTLNCIEKLHKKIKLPVHA